MSRLIIRIIVLMAAFIICVGSLEAQDTEPKWENKVFQLKSGKVIEGKVIFEGGQHYRIKMQDGSEEVIFKDDLLKSADTVSTVVADQNLGPVSIPVVSQPKSVIPRTLPDRTRINQPSIVQEPPQNHKIVGWQKDKIRQQGGTSFFSSLPPRTKAKFQALFGKLFNMDLEYASSAQTTSVIILCILIAIGWIFFHAFIIQLIISWFGVATTYIKTLKFCWATVLASITVMAVRVLVGPMLVPLVGSAVRAWLMLVIGVFALNIFLCYMFAATILGLSFWQFVKLLIINSIIFGILKFFINLLVMIPSVS